MLDISKLKNKYLFFISIIFFLFHLFTISSSSLPWIDEVMFIDMPVNILKTGKFYTTAYAAREGAIPFPTYPPLYSFLIFIWIKIFNFSLITIRSFNLILILVFSLLSISFLNNCKISKILQLNFLILLWFSNTFIWIFKNGRVDTLNMFICLLYFIVLNKKKPFIVLKIFIFNLLIISGLQASLFIFIFLLFFCFDNFDKYFRELKYFIVGSLMGLSFMTIYFLIFNQLLPFFSFLISSAKGIKKVTIFLIKLLNLKGFSFGPIKNNFEFNIISSFTQNSDFLLIFLINTALILYLSITKRINLNLIEVKTYFFVIFLTIVFSLTGHFIIYYTWMNYVPSIFLFLFLLKKCKYYYFAIPIVFIVFIGGLKGQFIESNSKTEINNIDIFLKKNIKDNNAVILSSFNAYYTIKNISKNVYFPGILPVSAVPINFQYIIYSENEFGSQQTLHLIKKNIYNKKLELVDSISSPKVLLYKYCQ